MNEELKNLEENALENSEKPKEESEQPAEKEKRKQVKEDDRDNARTMWVAASSEHGGEIQSWRMFHKSNLEYQEVQRLLRKYFEVSRKVGGKNIYKWNEEYDVPDMQEPEFDKPLDYGPKHPEFTQAGYIQRAMDEKERKADEEWEKEQNKEEKKD